VIANTTFVSSDEAMGWLTFRKYCSYYFNLQLSSSSSPVMNETDYYYLLDDWMDGMLLFLNLGNG